MARIRTVKPELFRHEGLFEAEAETGLPLRLAFIGLFTVADREGRFRWQPRQLKLDVMPYDSHDFSRVLDALMTRGFVVKYACANELYGVIPSFMRHQVINNREKASDFPSIDEADEIFDRSINEIVTREARVGDASITPLVQDQGEGKGREGNRKGKEKPFVPSADDTVGYSSEFEACWAKYPKRAGGNPKRSAWKAWKARLRAGVSAEELTHAVERYAAELLAKGKLGSAYVKQAATFFGPDEHWREALASNLHALPAGRDAAGKLQAGFYYHPDDNGLPAEKRRVINGATHDPATGYSLDYMRRKGML